ncbi:MAG TPA: pseudouridine synthase [Gemmatimonadales bacterium]|jgi:pseudouridine synthase|nr:pseudouridine synthase [Gemmatimonadales bacterium]
MSEIRVQRALAQAGIASRRQAEELITSGRVRVDGKVAELGSKVDPERQKLTVDGKPVRKVATRWIALHKPLGVVTTASDEQGRKTVLDLLPNPRGLTYVGRLDINTTGLLLLTTDGDAVHRLTHPRWHLPRRYVALVHGRDSAALQRMVTQRWVVDGRAVEVTGPRVRAGKDGRSVVDLVVHEGRNRIVRKWFEAMGCKVDRLARVQYGPIKLGDLAPGRWRVLEPAEVAALYKAVGMKG